MVILFLSELQLGTASEPSKQYSSGYWEAVGKRIFSCRCLLFFKVLNEPRKLQIYFEPIFSVITFLGVQFNVLSESQTEQGLQFGLPDN
jgi:hypothetical protein